MSIYLRCEEHPDFILLEDYHAGDLICPVCGLVVGDRIIDVSAEWRTFASDVGKIDKCRVGSVQVYDTVSSTITSSTICADDGHKIRTPKCARDNVMTRARATISDIVTKLRLTSQIMEDAIKLFAHVYDNQLTNGRKYNVLHPVCVYIICRRLGVPRTYSELAKVCTIHKSEMGTLFLKLDRNLASHSNPTSSTDYVARFCNQLGLEFKVEKTVKRVANAIKTLKCVDGKRPGTIIACAITIALSLYKIESTSIDAVASVSGITTNTIKQTINLLKTTPEYSNILKTLFA